MQRRQLLKTGAMTTAAFALRSIAAQPEANAAMPIFSTEDPRWQRAYDKAISILAANVQVMPRYAKPVLIEGSEYAGIWQECGPHEGLVYRNFRPDVARNGHMTFFTLQRADGQLPANNKRSEAGFGQIQMVVPIAATAWDLANATGDSELLETAYTSCSQWDEWLAKYRNTRGTGLVEGFCTYDTGMDNSPRWAGVRPQCPNKDAKICPDTPGLPRLCPDLSATVYGGRVALAAMARALGKSAEADKWDEHADTLRKLILDRLFVPQDAAFYDLDAQNRFVTINCDILSRVCGEHVVDAKLFNTLWERQLNNPAAFWAPYPLPSVALNDPQFVRPLQHNSWGGPSQALTALRAVRWMDFYGKHAEFAHMMQQWCEAIQRDMTFRQQIDPLTGAFTQEDLPNYSPAALVMYDFTWRLAGVQEEHDELHWNVRTGHAAAQNASFHATYNKGRSAVSMRYSAKGAELMLNGYRFATAEGTARIVTDKAGKLLYVVGVDTKPQQVRLRSAGVAHKQLLLEPNAHVLLAH